MGTIISKLRQSVSNIIEGITDGSTIVIGGFGRNGQPVELINAPLEQGAFGFTVVSNNAGNGETGLAALLADRPCCPHREGHPGGCLCEPRHRRAHPMVRGGHLDVCVLGAFEVSEHGDLANWHTGAPGAIPAVGRPMDLAIGAKQVFVMTDLLARDGSSKLVAACSFPLTAVRCVSRVYTDRAVFDVTPEASP